MFTDDAVTPLRLEILIDLLRAQRQGLSRDDLYRLLQPEPLAEGRPTFTPAKATVSAALELLLVQEKEGRLSLSESCRKEKDAPSAILAAFDQLVLSSVEVEKYFALFYSYFLGLGKGVYPLRNQGAQQWADQFNSIVFSSLAQANPFNETKVRGLHRWLGYVGLGWYDPSDSSSSCKTFQANPYDRIMRALPFIFGRARKLAGDDFMSRLAAACPELDGGNIFLQANPAWQAEDKKCTLGLSHALIELHLDEVIKLDCLADSSGWILGEAEPPRDDHFVSDRLSMVTFLSRE